MVKEKSCSTRAYYVKEYKDDFTVKHYGYGKIKVRPACSFNGNYGFVSHDTAIFCKWYEEKSK